MSRSRAEQTLAEFTTVSGAARRPANPPRPATHGPVGLLLAGGVVLAILLLATRTENPLAPSAGATAVLTPSAPVSEPPSALTSAVAAGPLWPSALTPIVSCQGAQQPAGPDASGSAPYQNVAKASIDAAFARWLQVDGDVVAFLPTAEWTKADGADEWARFDHLVNGAPKASVLFSAAPEGSDIRWSWQLAACAPAEFAPGADVTSTGRPRSCGRAHRDADAVGTIAY